MQGKVFFKDYQKCSLCVKIRWCQRGEKMEIWRGNENDENSPTPVASQKGLLLWKYFLTLFNWNCKAFLIYWR